MSDALHGRVPLAIPDLRGREFEYLQRCVTENWVSSAGPEVAAFERAVARYAGTSQAVATVNGTAALHLALVISGIGRGDRVLVPDWTFAATANAVVHVGAEPVFVDVADDSWTIDPRSVEAAIEAHSPKAIVAVHALGHPADMDALLSVAAEAGLLLIEDAAGAIGARYKGRPVGGLGDSAIFSFNGNKTVTAGGGGAVVTNDGQLADRARSLSTQARPGRAYRHDAVGFNYRMPNINAALGLAQLERLDEMVTAKRAIAARYDAALAAREDLELMPRCSWAESSCWLYSVRCAGRDDAEALVAHLEGAGIEARVFWETLSGQEPYASFPAVQTGQAKALSGTVVSLPCSSYLSEPDQGRVIDALARWRGNALPAAA